MNHGYVTLDEVFGAAAARAASLVPETSGYLALALGDATTRPPLGHEDRAVMLTTEGSVSLIRRGDAVSPRQAARELRDVLARLLAASAGTMPGLAGAARPREESDRGVPSVVSEIEAALIPVNRAAARRALARLARETLRAREAGKLRPAEPAPVTPSHDPTLVLAAEEPARGIDAATLPCLPAEPTPTTLGMAPVESFEPPPAAGIDLDLPTELDPMTRVAASSPTPSLTVPFARARLAPPTSAPPATPRIAIRADVLTRADVLLSQFGVSCGGDAGMRAAAACLKKLADLEPTPPPPAKVQAQAQARAAAAVPPSRPPPAAPREPFDDLLEMPPPRPAPRARRSSPAIGVGAALLVGAVAGAFAVARVRPDLVTSITARITATTGETPPAPPASEAKAR